jgi:hypothetical protein
MPGGCSYHKVLHLGRLMFYAQRFDEASNVKATYQQNICMVMRQEVTDNIGTPKCSNFSTVLYIVSLKSLIFFVIYVFVIKLEYFR